MTILQLSPSIPVFVIDKGLGYALAIIDYSQEHFVHFIVALDHDGSIHICDNRIVRLQKNLSLGRDTDNAI